MTVRTEIDQDFLDDLSLLLDDDRYEFAWNTLDDFETKVKRGAWPTAAMRSAVEHIKRIASE